MAITYTIQFSREENRVISLSNKRLNYTEAIVIKAIENNVVTQTCGGNIEYSISIGNENDTNACLIQGLIKSSFAGGSFSSSSYTFSQEETINTDIEITGDIQGQISFDLTYHKEDSEITISVPNISGISITPNISLMSIKSFSVVDANGDIVESNVPLTTDWKNILIGESSKNYDLKDFLFGKFNGDGTRASGSDGKPLFFSDGSGDGVMSIINPDETSVFQEIYNNNKFLRDKMFGIYNDKGEQVGSFLNGAEAIKNNFKIKDFEIKSFTDAENGVVYYLPVPTGEISTPSDEYASYLQNMLQQSSFMEQLLNLQYFWQNAASEPWTGITENNQTVTVVSKNEVDNLFPNWVDKTAEGAS